MNKLMKKNINLLINITFVLSMLSLCFIFTISTQNYLESNYEIISLILTLIFSLYLIKKRFAIELLRKSKIKDLILSLAFSLVTMYEINKTYSLSNASPSIVDFITKFHLIRVCKYFTEFFSIFFLIILYLYLLENVLPLFIKFIEGFDKEEKNVCTKYFIVMLILITISYCLCSSMYTGYDLVLSLDTGYVTEYMFKDMFWALDIRHILFAPLVIPIKIIITCALNIFPDFSVLYPILLAIFNLILILLTAVMLKRLTNSKWTFYLYLFSYPTLLFSLFIEKYQLCIFLIVSFLYFKKESEEELSNAAIIASVGAMSTSALLGFFSGEGTIKNKILNWIKISMIFIGLTALFGKIYLILSFFEQSNTILGNIAELQLKNRLYGVSELFYSILYIPNYYLADNGIMYANAANSFNVIGLIILVISIVGFAFNRKNKICQICFYWLCIAFVLFVGLKWYCFEAPLFNLYFSWAVIPLFVAGIEKICKKYKNTIYISLIASMILVNTIGLINMISLIFDI